MSGRQPGGPDLYRISEQLGRLNAQLEAMQEAQNNNRDAREVWSQNATARLQTMENEARASAEAFERFRSEVSDRLKQMEGPVRDMAQARRKIITTIGWVGSIVGFLAAVGAPVWSPIANRIGTWIVGH
jgi:hypothetical protein